MKNLTEILRAQVAAHPHRPLLITESGPVTYYEFFRRAWAMGSFFAQNTAPSDRVAVESEEPLTVWAALFGAWMHGRVAVLVPMTMAPFDRKWLKEKAKVKITLDDAIAATIPNLQGEGSRGEERDPESWHAVLATSGSSGEPKAVCVSLRALSLNAAGAAQRLGLTSEDRFFVNTPPYYTSSLLHFLSLLSVGGSLVCRRGFFFAQKLLTLMAETRCTGFGGAPAHLQRLIFEQKLTSLPRTLRYWVSSGDALSVRTVKTVIQNTELKLFVMYGLTEVSGRLCILDCRAHLQKPGSVGRPLPGMTVTVRDEKGRPLPRNIVGELHVQGDTLMLGYLGEEGEIIPAGPLGFGTGDFGYCDADGDYFLEGRRDEVIKSGAEKVSLKRIREALLTQPEIKDALVLAISDLHLGHVPAAFVVSKGINETSRALERLRAVLPTAYFPKLVKTLECLPVLGSGKWDRRMLTNLGSDAFDPVEEISQ